MYKLHHDHNDTDILIPECIQTDAISVVEVGHSSPPAGYSSLKNKRSVYVLHYLLQGKGTFSGYTLEGPCGFLMTPEELQYYSVDPNPDSPPWEQYWIMFRGDHAPQILANAGFSLTQHVFDIPNIQREWSILREIFQTPSYYAQNDGYHLLSVLFQLLSLHDTEESNTASQYSPYVRSALTYIRDFYSLNLCEDDIANAVHISTKYLHKLFRDEVGEPPMKYLNFYRIRCARRLLLNSNFSIGQIAASVGFSDSNYFCRVFQRFNDGVSPLQYRKNIRNASNTKGGMNHENKNSNL